jgi:hypothetical protein
MKPLVLPICALLLFFSACKKNSFISSPDARLGTSIDTVRFDTVFTSTGSITQSFRIYNLNNQKLRISSVELAGGQASFFKMNVDGTAGEAVNNLEIDANDSIYVFVSVKIDPNASNLPFVISDSILINFNGQEAKVQLQAWGQNAHFLRNAVISTNETWTNDLPYVILGGLNIKEGASLQIEKGSRIYLHADAPILVNGTLSTHGEAGEGNEVSFRGDRLDEPYKDYPAAWPGIYFSETSTGNELHHTRILNAYQGLVAAGEDNNGQTKLRLYQCVIDNCYDAGLLALHSSVYAENCLISNCGKNMVLAYGGEYSFWHCSNIAYSNPFVIHKEPVLLLTDYLQDGSQTYTAAMDAQFTNCLFWGDFGSVDNEVASGRLGSLSFSALFKNCLWKMKSVPQDLSVANMIENQEPLFDSVNTQRNYYNFHSKPGSSLIDAGSSSPQTEDLDGQARPVNLPDIGCYEKQ